MKIQRTITGLIASVLLLAAIPTALASDVFSDVPSTHANYEAINDLKLNGVISGYPDGTFKPDQTVNRVEVLKMIFEGLEVIDPQTTKTPSFPDIDPNAWYASYLTKAYSLGMVEGYPDGTFKPAQTVNLVENLKLMLEAANVTLPGTVMEDPYNDAPKDEWYAKYVQYAKDKNLIEPDQNFNIYPAKGMTRGDFAEALYRLRTVIQKGLDRFQKEEPIIDNQLELYVRIEDFSFMPQTLTVGKGTKVTWTNYDSSTHTVTADDGTWDSGNLQQDETFSKTFNELGTFTYKCTIHPSMTGTIIVKPANEVPTI